MGNNTKVWFAIAALFVIIGVGLSLFLQKSYEKRVHQMAEQCEKNGGEAVITEKGSFLTKEYHFTCKE